MDAVVVGELNADLILSGLAAIPNYGELQLARGMRLTLGSSSAIFACNLARLGISVGFVGKVGNDMVGSFLVERLESSGVDTSRIVRAEGAQTGYASSCHFLMIMRWQLSRCPRKLLLERC